MAAAPVEPIVALSTSLRRFYPQSTVYPCSELSIDAARGEKVSFQVVVRTQDEASEIEVTVQPLAGVVSRTRRVGYVSVKHLNTHTPRSELEGAEFIPGLAPDPLFPECKYTAGAWETNAFWVNLTPDTSIAPGDYRVPIEVRVGDSFVSYCVVNLTVHRAVLGERAGFPVTHWFYCDALSDWYRLKPFEESFWPILEMYVANLVEHGNDVMHTPIFTPSTDGVKKPTQLVRVRKDGDRYVFEWSLVKRFVEMAKACGVQAFEWAHFFTQWGCRSAIRIYEGEPEDEKLLWPPETPATSPVYRGFLEQFLPELKAFLREEGILEASYFHISDEPHGDEALENYRTARQMMRELAPWMKFMDALSQLSFALEGLVDLPIPILDEAPAFVAAGFPAWCYFCGGPRGDYLNRLIDTPLVKIRMSGWLFYRLGSRGFLHWGYNYWHRSQTRELIDPYTEQSGDSWPGWSYGDTFVVYPGPDGPIDSIRWESFAESLQDFTLLRLAGVSREDPFLSGIEDYASFPKSEDWILSARRSLLARLDAITEP
ncbi:MAG: DUF4091 domain-containing protein [Fimbriimonas sp.]|nr:DUF4091 domain-containing protein [Fimbriimonas sp.]